MASCVPAAAVFVERFTRGDVLYSMHPTCSARDVLFVREDRVRRHAIVYVQSGRGWEDIIASHLAGWRLPTESSASRGARVLAHRCVVGEGGWPRRYSPK